MKIEKGKTYPVNKNGVLGDLHNSLTITSIIKLADGSNLYKTREGYSLFSDTKYIDGWNGRWNVNNVLKILTLKEERKIKLDKLDKVNKWWRVW